MNYLAETKRYYAEWLSVSSELLDQNGVFCFYSPERDAIQVGYSKSFDLYCYISGQTTIITFGCKLEHSIDWVQEFFQTNGNLAEFKKIVKEKLGKNLQQDFKYYFAESPSDIDVSKARQLTKQDYSSYLHFFKTQYPDSQAETWLADYFNVSTSKGYVFGFYVGDELVSVSDSPDMPYMNENVVELGINTLAEYRNKGYAKIVLGAMLEFVTSIQKVPIVSCASSNIASKKLIEGVGFAKLADVVSLSI
jgi:RimJ/RimL family protein N-acetyltransferase